MTIYCPQNLRTKYLLNYHCIDNTTTDLVLSTHKGAASVVCVVEELGTEPIALAMKESKVRGNGDR